MASGLSADASADASTGKISGTGRTCTALILLCRPATPTNKLLYVAPTS